MNLFLHGVSDFHIVNDDTLKKPAFIENGELMKFDLVLANPPYSIKQWDREAFSADKYGRNFLGTPPQGRADYAFFQHILKSLDDKTGRCAILFPHGVLTRNDEKYMREKLVKSDLIECVIGIGKNLFFNSPMEATIIICRTQKSPERKGKILFINAKNEVTRKNSESFLEEEHIERISETYMNFSNEEGFSAIVTLEQILSNGASLGVPLYVSNNNSDLEMLEEDLNDCISEWLISSDLFRESYSELRKMFI